MRLAETDAAVDEQRVVRTRRRFGDGAAGGMRELVGGSDDEGVEGVAGPEPRLSCVGSRVFDLSFSEGWCPRGGSGAAASASSVMNSREQPPRSTSRSASSRTAE